MNEIDSLKKRVAELEKANRELVDAVHTAKDITGYHKTAEALRESEMKYKTIFESSADAIMLLDPGKGFISGNTATIKLFGCKNEAEFISHTPDSLSPKYQPDGELSSTKAQKMIDLAIEEGFNFFEWTHCRVNGEEFFAAVLFTRMKFGAQTILQATVRDITERILLERQLAKKLRDFEIFYKAAIDREMKIKELKKKVQELEAKIRG